MEWSLIGYAKVNGEYVDACYPCQVDGNDIAIGMPEEKGEWESVWTRFSMKNFPKDFVQFGRI